MNNVIDLAVELAACLCQQISDSALQDVCFCGVIPGDAATDTYFGNCTGKNGMAWVRIANIYPSQSVGIADQTIGNCSTGLGADIEIGIMRTIQIAEGTRNLPDSTILAQTAQQVDEAMLMRQAVVCCDALDQKDYILGAYTPIGPMGTALGGSWVVHVGVY